MGKGSPEYHQQINQALGGLESRAALKEAAVAEGGRGQLQSKGMTRNWDAHVEPRLKEIGAEGGRGQFNDLGEFASFVTDYQNEQMAEVRRLEEAGDSEGASKLFGELEGLHTRLNPANAGVQGGAWEKAFGFAQSSEGMAEMHGRSTMGQIVDQQVYEGKEILDRDSETSQAYRRSLTEGATRTTMARERGALRQGRDFGLQRGSARNPAQAAQIQAGISRDFGQQMAQIQTQAAQQYEGYRTALGHNAVAFANSWIDQAAGVRDEYTQMNMQMHSETMKMLTAFSQQNVDMWTQESDENMAKDAAKAQLISAGIGAVGSVSGAMIGPAGMLGKAASPSIVQNFGKRDT